MRQAPGKPGRIDRLAGAGLPSGSAAMALPLIGETIVGNGVESSVMALATRIGAGASGAAALP